jgi:hypothetical protein
MREEEHLYKGNSSAAAVNKLKRSVVVVRRNNVGNYLPLFYADG